MPTKTLGRKGGHYLLEWVTSACSSRNGVSPVCLRKRQMGTYFERRRGKQTRTLGLPRYATMLPRLARECSMRMTPQQISVQQVARLKTGVLGQSMAGPVSSYDRPRK